MDIKVTPNAEDAFFFLNAVENHPERISDSENVAGKRLAMLPKKEQEDAIHTAYLMIDNVKKYGIPCAEWA